LFISVSIKLIDSNKKDSFSKEIHNNSKELMVYGMDDRLDILDIDSRMQILLHITRAYVLLISF
jgi:hypothetical protein